MNKQNILVTGAAGFIGYHLSKRLCENGWNVMGIDNLNNYYDTRLKESRLAMLSYFNNFNFQKTDISDKDDIMALFESERFDYVINLAAQAGVRYSLTNPYVYIESNINGFLNILEGCRHFPVKHLVYASSSSVYGANTKIPFSVQDNVDHPVSLYAATKKSNELLAHAYSGLYNIPVSGLRFFTVYGPWGRPDMAYFIFTKSIIESRPIEIFNYGKMKRDFTYIDDIIEGIIRILDKIPGPDPEWKNNSSHDISRSFAPYRLYNIGNNQPVELEMLVSTIEKKLDKIAIRNYKPMQPGDVESTFADIDDLSSETGFKPSVSIEEGINNFIDWYLEYYNVVQKSKTAI
jgi:UDP-glucuronate 4-epimerase